MAETYTVQQLAKLAGDFVVKKRGSWDHEAWEEFCGAAAALGVEPDEEMRARLGLLLETLKVFYVSLPKRAKTLARRKTRTKTKSKAKAKAKPRAKAAASIPPSGGVSS
ncbi:MAG: hypothetical protein GXY07_12105 [Candidatus Hydrogenedentes bacterium]|nr:hypothetical protein [Candidatus Hydrogenedentota bacterium]